MKRRDLIKTGLLGLGASAVALSGCDKKEESVSELNIVPKQTGLYEFSVPLPVNYKTIDEIIELNSTLKKSRDLKRQLNSFQKDSTMRSESSKKKKQKIIKKFFYEYKIPTQRSSDLPP